MLMFAQPQFVVVKKCSLHVLLVLESSFPVVGGILFDCRSLEVIRVVEVLYKW